MIATATFPSSLARPLAEFRTTRARTLAMIEGLTQEQLDYKPAPSQWSVGEVLDHMLLGERINREQVARLIELQRQGQRPELPLTFSDLNISIVGIPRSLLQLLEGPLTLMNLFVPDGVRNYLTRNRLILFRNPDQATPRRGRPARELKHKLVESLKNTEALFQNNPDLDYEQMTLQHPLLGTYNVPGLLRFMSAHEERHQSQIADIQRAAGFPLSTRCSGARYA